MGREQDLILAVKNGDVSSVQKLVAKVKAAKTSESGWGRGCLVPSPGALAAPWGCGPGPLQAEPEEDRGSLCVLGHLNLSGPLLPLSSKELKSIGLGVGGLLNLDPDSKGPTPPPRQLPQVLLAVPLGFFVCFGLLAHSWQCSGVSPGPRPQDLSSWYLGGPVDVEAGSDACRADTPPHCPVDPALIAVLSEPGAS